MPGEMERVCFHETFGLSELLSPWLWRHTTFVNAESFAARQVLKRFRPRRLKTRTLSDGDVASSPGIKGTAYRNALKKAEESLRDFDCLFSGDLLGIDMELITRKLLVELLVRKYQFYGLARQYAAEHPDRTSELYVNSVVAGEAPPVIPGLRVVAVRRFPRIQFILSLLAIPFYCILFYRKNRAGTETRFADSIVCQVDGKKSYNMFAALFGGRSNLHYVTEKYCLVDGEHHEYFGIAEARRLGITVKGLNRRDYTRLKTLAKRFITMAIANFRGLSRHGLLLFELFSSIARGILQTVDARDSVFLAYEHLILPNAVRNELLRADGNLSISLPYGTQIESHFFSSGYQYNYDILCSTGKLQERVYAMQQARTRVMLPVGSYEINKGIPHDDAFLARIQRLRAFKGGDTGITILSSGIQAETYSGETRLLQLARRLATESKVKVFIRPKPLPPPEEFRDTMSGICGGHESIMITGPEYQLTDFLEVSDLFITFASHSAADICAAGGRIFSVNFMADEAFSLWQNTVPGVYLNADTAFDTIVSWLRDAPAGTRAVHDRRMAELSGLISYRYDTFASYKNNLLQQLDPYLPCTTDRLADTVAH
jgi:hypothetical protein